MREGSTPPVNAPGSDNEERHPYGEHARRDVERVGHVVQEAYAIAASMLGVCAHRTSGQDPTDETYEVSHLYSLCSAP